jgi:hypothetical protein
MTIRTIRKPCGALFSARLEGNELVRDLALRGMLDAADRHAVRCPACRQPPPVLTSRPFAGLLAKSW